MFSILRGAEPKRRSTAHLQTITYEDGAASQTFHPPTADFFVTHTIPHNKSMFNPPLHLHLYQRETFLVHAGTGIWHQPTAPAALRTQTRTKDQSIDLPAGTFHRFENASATEPLVVSIRCDPPGGNGVGEEAFFRNFFGYLEDCRREGVGPSVFQLELFMYTVDGPLAIPVPGGDAVKWWFSRGMMWLLGVFVGEWLLGYRRSYEEYYCGKDTGC